MATAWWIDYIGSALLAEAEALGMAFESYQKERLNTS
jgi:hypothetical protein